MRNKLLEAIKPLQLNTNDKNKLVNTIIDIGNSGGGSVASQYAPRYFKIDWDKASEDWKYVLSITDINGMNTTPLTIGSSYKIVNGEGIAMVTAYPFSQIINSATYSFTYIPTFISKLMIDSFHIEHNPGIQTFENLIIFMNKLMPIAAGINVNITMEGITEITEEEFYKID